MSAADRVLARAMAKVMPEPMSGCWLWTGALSTAGYGRLQMGRDATPAVAQAHRVVYEALVGPIPDGLQLDHLCRTRACVNHAHLEPVTATDNMRRGHQPMMVVRRSGRCARGHVWTPATERRRANGTRSCRLCERAVRSGARRAGDWKA